MWCLGNYSGAMKVRDLSWKKSGRGGGEESWNAEGQASIWADDGGLLLYPEDGACIQRVAVGTKGARGSDRGSWGGGAR